MSAAVVPGAIAEVVHERVPSEQLQPAGAVRETGVVPAGALSETVTVRAVLGPSFLATSV